MKIILSIFLFSIFLGVSLCDEKERDEVNAEIFKDAKIQMSLIFGFVQNKDFEKLSDSIRAQEKSGVKRHAASSEKVARLLKNVDFNKVKFGKSFFSPEKSIVVVRIDAPIRMDFEYFYDPKSKTPLLLQAVHP